jgi:hypothetical protein
MHIINHSDKGAAWKAYDALVSNRSNMATDQSERFSREQAFFGVLPGDLAEKVQNCILSTGFVPFMRDDFAPGFVTVKWDCAAIETMNKISSYHDIGRHEAWILGDMLDFLKMPVADCLGSPWRVLNLRSWTTPPSTGNVEMYAWHTDNFVPEIFKILVYLVPLSEETGSVQVRLGGQEITHVSDAPGAWLLFNNTTIIHRGLPGTKANRTVIEITISRAADYDLTPRFPGLNSLWPEYPWVDTLVGCSTSELQRVGYRPEEMKIQPWVKLIPKTMLKPLSELMCTIGGKGLKDMGNRIYNYHEHLARKSELIEP